MVSVMAELVSEYSVDWQGFANPDAVLADIHLEDAGKRKLLEDWRTDVQNRLNAEAEGMSASDPISGEREARLADQLRKINTALEALDN